MIKFDSDGLGMYAMKVPMQLLTAGYQQLLRNPVSRWLVVLGTLVYLVSPFDLSPDLIPFLGQVDDVVLVTFLATQWWRWWLNQGNPDHPVPTRSPSRSQSSSSASEQVVDVDAVSLD